MTWPCLAVSFNADEAIKGVLSDSARILFIAVVAVVVIRVLNRLLTPVLRIAVREQMTDEPKIEVDKRMETLLQVVSRTTSTVVVVVAVLTALPEIGVNVAPLIAGVGIIGLAVGFGAQNLVRDVINGLFILLENQYGKGDVVEIAGKGGTVEDINLRRTVLRDSEGVVHFVPHGEVKTSSNKTRGYSRVSVDLSLAYDSDIDKAFTTVERVGKELAADPAWGPRIREAPLAEGVERFGDTSLQVRIGGVTEPGDQWAVSGELRRRLLLELAKAGVRFAASPVTIENPTAAVAGESGTVLPGPAAAQAPANDGSTSAPTPVVTGEQPAAAGPKTGSTTEAGEQSL